MAVGCVTSWSMMIKLWKLFWASQLLAARINLYHRSHNSQTALQFSLSNVPGSEQERRNWVSKAIRLAWKFKFRPEWKKKYSLFTVKLSLRPHVRPMVIRNRISKSMLKLAIWQRSCSQHEMLVLTHTTYLSARTLSQTNRNESVFKNEKFISE